MSEKNATAPYAENQYLAVSVKPSVLSNSIRQELEQLVENPSNHYWEPNDQLRNLTIVVPTFQRSEHLLRTVRFWSGKGPQLLVLDGSPNPTKDDGLFDSVKALTYVHMPESIQSRLVNSSDYIRTDYVTLMGDDEVHMPSSLTASIKELEGNPKLASCLGWSVGFWPRRGKESTREILGRSCYPDLHFRENTQESAQERLLTHFGQYVPSNIYSVVRKVAYGNALKLIALPGERVFAQSELEFELAMLYQGGNKVLPNLHWLRNFGDSGNSTQDADTNPQNIFHVRFLDPDYSAWRNDFLSTRALILASIDGEEAAQVRLWLEKSLLLYSEICARTISKPTLAARVASYLQIHLRSFVPEEQHHRVRKILKIIRRQNFSQSLQEAVRDLSLNGMKYSEAELNQVIEERIQA